ncbi:hypothetical protein Bbelb_039760 [Branchiostoma belcheri]|nr:hypothetical protein Bbelb_039760 [Branchiostoma belcheri]
MPKHIYDGDRCIQPHAVANREEHDVYDVYIVESGGAVAKNSMDPDDEGIQPYAIAYMVQGEVVCRTTSGDTLLASNSINDVATNPSGNDVPNGYEMEMGTTLRSGKSTGDLLPSFTFT